MRLDQVIDSCLQGFHPAMFKDHHDKGGQGHDFPGAQEGQAVLDKVNAGKCGMIQQIADIMKAQVGRPGPGTASGTAVP